MRCELHVCEHIYAHVHMETQDWCWDAFWIALPHYLWRQGCSDQTQSSTIWFVSLVSFPRLCLPRLDLQVLSHSHTAYGDSGDPNFCLLARLASGKGLTAEPSPQSHAVDSLEVTQCLLVGPCHHHRVKIGISPSTILLQGFPQQKCWQCASLK